MLRSAGLELEPESHFLTRSTTHVPVTLSCFFKELKSLQLENESLKLTLDKVQVQLDTSLDAQVGRAQLLTVNPVGYIFQIYL